MKNCKTKKNDTPLNFRVCDGRNVLANHFKLSLFFLIYVYNKNPELLFPRALSRKK